VPNDELGDALPTGPIECQTAFVVYLLPDGQWQVADDLDIPLIPARKPHGDDYTSGSATVMRDVSTREVAALLTEAVNVIIPNTVQGVIQGQMAMAAKAREQFEANAIAEKLEADKSRRGGRR
jgi:hypothetical protein